MKKNLSKIADPGEGKLKSLLKFAAFVFTKPGFGFFKRIVKKKFLKPGIDQIAYSDWIKASQNPALLQKDYENNFKTLKLKPKISILITAGDGLSTAISSVLEQSYSNWELIITGTTEIPANKDERIIPLGKRNAQSLLSGEYVLFMEHSDVLTPNCLFELVKHINAHPSDKLIYTDEDIADDNSSYSTPHFKPGWSPDSLLSHNYIGHTMAIKKELLTQVKNWETTNYYDLLLQSTELTNNIGHIPMILYHCHKHPFSAADDIASKKALSETMIRRQTPASITNVPDTTGCYHLNYEITKKDKVSIIIPTKDNTTLLRKALDSIILKTDDPDYEIIVLNNNSTSTEFFQLVKDYTEKHPAIFRCINANFPFNFAKLMNFGVAQIKGTYILMCNNDIEVIHNDWMTQMVSYAQLQHVGTVGVKLLYPDNTIQHAGIVLDKEEGSRHLYVNKPGNDNGYCYALKTVTNYAAVTAACLMCRKEVYNEAGGMDEALAVEYNDVDLCLKLMQHGYYNVYLPTVELYHYESATRGHPFRSKESWKQHEKELAIFKSKWQSLLDNDPFYNPNLKLNLSQLDT